MAGSSAVLSRAPRASLAARLVAFAGAVLVAGVLALAPAASASAHDYLVSSTPKNGSTVSTPLKAVVLTFDDRVLDLSGDGSSNVVEITSGSRHYESGCPTIADTKVTLPVALGDSGRYTVTWQVVSADGHVVSASIGFDYSRPQDARAAPGASSRPACGNQSGSKSGSSGDTGAGASTASGSTASSLPVALGIGGGIVVVALVAVAVVLRRSRAADAAAAADADRAEGQRQQPRREPRSRRQPPPPPGA